MAYFPMFVDMTERECLIVGGAHAILEFPCTPLLSI